MSVFYEKLCEHTLSKNLHDRYITFRCDNIATACCKCYFQCCLLLLIGVCLAGCPNDPGYYAASDPYAEPYGQWSLWSETIDDVNVLGNDRAIAHVNLGTAPQTIYGDPYPSDFSGNAPGSTFYPVTIAFLETGIDMNYTGLVNTPPYYAGSYEGTNIDLSSTGLTGHPDLNPNQWFNTDEIPDNGLDDDGNGYKDDHCGWDFVGDTGFYDTPDQAGWPDNCPAPSLRQPPLAEWPEAIGGMTLADHGTGMSSISAARGNNGLGMAGVVWGAKIMPVKYSDGTYDAFAESSRMPDANRGSALAYAANNGARVIEISYPTSTYNLDDHHAIQRARARGLFLTTPSCNGNKNLDEWPTFPACYPEVVAVGATNKYDRRVNPCGDPHNGAFGGDWYWSTGAGLGSNYGFALDLVTPSATRLSNVEGGTDERVGIRNCMATFDVNGVPVTSPYGRGGGTSSTAPHVAGCAALMLQGDPALSPSELQAYMQWSAVDLNYTETHVTTDTVHHGHDSATDFTAGTPSTNRLEVAGPGRDRYTGWGLLNVQEAVNHAASARFTYQGSVPGSTQLVNIASWTSAGHFVIDGRIDTSKTLAQLPGITPVDAGQLVQIMDNSVPPRIVAVLDKTRRFDETSKTMIWPKLYLPGAISTDLSTLTPPTGAALIQVSGVTVGYFDGTGMYIKGKSFEGANPDPSAKKFGTVRRVGSGYATIQAAIDACSSSVVDIVVVPVGTYDGCISLKGKKLILTSTAPWNWDTVKTTILRGNTANTPTVRFADSDAPTPNNDRSRYATIQGFTITRVPGSTYNGNGINGKNYFGMVKYNIVKACTTILTEGSAITNFRGVVQDCKIYGNKNLSETLGSTLVACSGDILRNEICFNYAATSASVTYNCSPRSFERNDIHDNYVKTSSSTSQEQWVLNTTLALFPAKYKSGNKFDNNRCLSQTAGKTFVVGTDAPAGTWKKACIQAAIDAVPAGTPGYKVIVYPGIYNEAVNFSGKSIELVSTSPLDSDIVADTVIQRPSSGATITMSNNCRLEGFYITHGTDAQNLLYQGVGVEGNYYLVGRIANNKIVNNHNQLSDGGGIRRFNGTICDNTINGNRAANGGALANCDGPILRNVIKANIADNIGGGSGGGLYDCGGAGSLVYRNMIEANIAVILDANGEVIGSGFGGACADCAASLRRNSVKAWAAYGGFYYQCTGPITENKEVLY